MPKRDYVLIQGMSAAALGANVTAAMAQGWSLYGSAFASIAQDDTKAIVETLYQAMILTVPAEE
jgi:hypothetical protein